MSHTLKFIFLFMISINIAKKEKNVNIFRFFNIPRQVISCNFLFFRVNIFYKKYSTLYPP